MGSPKQFEGMKTLLEGSGADIHTLTLPGHGKSVAEFCEADAEDWLAGVRQRLRDLSRDYERIVIVGHSMGGLLAVIAATEQPKKVSAVVAIAFPLRVTLTPEWVSMMNKTARSPRPDDSLKILASRRLSGVPVRGAGKYFSVMPNQFELLKIAAKAREALPKLKARLLVFNFTKDEIVARSVPELTLKLQPAAEVTILPESFHFLFDPEEERLMAKAVRQMTDNR
jgi:carboxylesterase